MEVLIMNTFISLIFPVVCVVIAALVAKVVMKRSGNIKRSLVFNFSSVGVMVLLFALMSFSAAADTTATTEAAVEVAKYSSINAGLGYIAAGLCTGLAGIGGGIALAGGVPAAIGAVSEDPKAFGKALIFVALGETVALYGVVISFLIISNLPKIAM